MSVVLISLFMAALRSVQFRASFISSYFEILSRSPPAWFYNIILTVELFGLIRDKNHSLLTKYLPTRSLDKCTESVVMGSLREVIWN